MDRIVAERIFKAVCEVPDESEHLHAYLYDVKQGWKLLPAKIRPRQVARSPAQGEMNYVVRKTSQNGR